MKSLTKFINDYERFSKLIHAYSHKFIAFCHQVRIKKKIICNLYDRETKQIQP